jgi:hypothetical protein
MTPDDEVRFIALWRGGVETAEIARQLGIKTATAQSRAYGLQQRGLIQPRPRGGAYPSLRAQERGRAGEGVFSQTPRVSHRTPGVLRGMSGGCPKECLSRSSPPCRPPQEVPR